MAATLRFGIRGFEILHDSAGRVPPIGEDPLRSDAMAGRFATEDQLIQFGVLTD